MYFYTVEKLIIVELMNKLSHNYTAVIALLLTL